MTFNRKISKLCPTSAVARCRPQSLLRPFWRSFEPLLLLCTVGQHLFAFLCTLDWFMNPVPRMGEYHVLATKAAFEITNAFRVASMNHIHWQPKEEHDGARLCGGQALTDYLFFNCFCFCRVTLS